MAALPSPHRRARAALAWAAAALAIALPGAVAAQARTATVVGYVIDTAGAPVPAAEVVVEGAPSRTRSSASGEFRLAGVRAGGVKVVVRRLGYQAWSDRFDIPQGDSVQLIVSLTAVPAELPGVRVVAERTPRLPSPLADFERRRTGGYGQFMTREEIVRHRPSRATDLFRYMAGVTVVPGPMGSAEVRMARSMQCGPAVYVDGREALDFRVDDFLPQEIEAIEVFRGPSEIPAQFRHMSVRGDAPPRPGAPSSTGMRMYRGAQDQTGPDCGVVSIWTRVPGTTLP